MEDMSISSLTSGAACWAWGYVAIVAKLGWKEALDQGRVGDGVRLTRGKRGNKVVVEEEPKLGGCGRTGGGDMSPLILGVPL